MGNSPERVNGPTQPPTTLQDPFLFILFIYLFIYLYILKYKFHINGKKKHKKFKRVPSPILALTILEQNH